MWILSGAVGLAGIWWLTKNKAPFAVGDRVFLIASPGFGLGTVLAVQKFDWGWMVVVRWDINQQVIPFPAPLLKKAS